jgi:hypothetical protein
MLEIYLNKLKRLLIVSMLCLPISAIAKHPNSITPKCKVLQVQVKATKYKTTKYNYLVEKLWRECGI